MGKFSVKTKKKQKKIFENHNRFSFEFSFGFPVVPILKLNRIEQVNGIIEFLLK